MHRRRAYGIRSFALFLFLWLTVGFTLGTALLLGPVRWIATLCREHGFYPAVEKVAVMAIILLLVGASAGLAFYLSRVALDARSRATGAACIVGPALLAFGALWLWMNPALLRAGMGQVTTTGMHFTFGPYPDQATLRRLHREGYTAVISLLHPAVVPFEPALLAEEKTAAAKAEIELIQAPMLPWISNNADSLRMVEELARRGTGRYYVHCYLGMDRIQLVRNIVERVDPTARIEGKTLTRSLRDAGPLERGEIYELEPGVFLGPFPAESEFLRFLIPAGIRSMVSLLDPSNPGDMPWIEREREIAERLHLTLVSLPLPSGSDEGTILEATKRVRTLERPVYVHAFLSPSTNRAPIAASFRQLYRGSAS